MDTYTSQSEQETQNIAAQLAKKVTSAPQAPKIVALYGNLGAGKTVFTKGFAQQLGVELSQIKSPTYTFVREYQGQNHKIYHFDFYRVIDEDDIIDHEVESILEKPHSIAIIEWPERIAATLNSHPLTSVTIEYLSEHERKIVIN